MHGVGLSLGGEAPLDTVHLARVQALLARYRPAVFSEHLAWSTHDGRFFNDLLPLRYDAACLARVCRHIEQVQERIGLQLLLDSQLSSNQREQLGMVEQSARHLLRLLDDIHGEAWAPSLVGWADDRLEELRDLHARLHWLEAAFQCWSRPG